MPLLPAYKSLFMVRVEPVFILIYEPHHAGEVILYVRLSKVVSPSIFIKKWPFPPSAADGAFCFTFTTTSPAVKPALIVEVTSVVVEKSRLRSLPATSDTVGVHFEVSFQSNFSVTSPFYPVISERLSAPRVPIMEAAAKA